MAALSVPYSVEHSVDLMDTCSVYLRVRSMVPPTEQHLVDVTDNSLADSMDTRSAATTDYSPERYSVDYSEFHSA